MSRFKLSYFKIFLSYVSWWSIWIVIQLIFLRQIGFDWSTAFTDAIITQAGFALAGYIINTSMHSYRPSARNSWKVLGWSIALSAIIVFLQRWILLDFLIPTDSYAAFFDNSAILRGAFGWFMTVLIAIITWFGVYMVEHQDNEKDKNDATQLARDAELSNLRQQLQPHFLFNSLNSISALAGSRPEEARKMIQQLSDFLRGTIKKDNASLVTLEEELSHLQLYLDIEKVRFGHRLNTLVTKSEESINMKLPSLLLQPIVENAIKFGLYDTIGEVTISIDAWRENSLLYLQVKNPFDPTTSTPKRGTGFGLTSVQRRLYLLYYRNDLLNASQQENFFITTIKIPQTV